MTVPINITGEVQRLWATGLDSLAIAEAPRWHWPRLHANEIEPIVCRLLNQARDDRRKGRGAA